MFVKGMYFYVFYCLCYDTDIYTYMSDKKGAEQIYPDLNEEEDIRLDEIREEHSRNVAEEGDEKKEIHDLRWDV